MISFKDHAHRANFRAVKKCSMNSHKICTIAVRVFAIESGASWWECHAAAAPIQYSSTLAKQQWQRGWAIEWVQGEYLWQGIRLHLKELRTMRTFAGAVGR